MLVSIARPHYISTDIYIYMIVKPYFKNKSESAYH
jgi:hypothetical protein